MREADIGDLQAFLGELHRESDRGLAQSTVPLFVVFVAAFLAMAFDGFAYVYHLK